MYKTDTVRQQALESWLTSRHTKTLYEPPNGKCNYHTLHISIQIEPQCEQIQSHVIDDVLPPVGVCEGHYRRWQSGKRGTIIGIR